MASTYRYLAFRLGRAGVGLLFGATLVFLIIHFGPKAPLNQSAATLGLENTEAFQQRLRDFGLTQPMWRQYLDYLSNMFMLDFGETWMARETDIAENQTTSNVNTLVSTGFQRTVLLWIWTGLLAIMLIVMSIVTLRNKDQASIDLRMGVLATLPVFLLALIFETGFASLDRIAFGLNWREFLVTTPVITRPIPTDELGTIEGVLLASKLAIPPALALAIPLAAIVTVIWNRNYRMTGRSGYVTGATARGLSTRRIILKHVFPNALSATASIIRPGIIFLIGGTILVEEVFRLNGLGSIFYSSILRADYTTLQATMFVWLGIVAIAWFSEDVLRAVFETSPETGRENQYTQPLLADQNADTWAPPERLRELRSPTSSWQSFRSNPSPAIFWVAICIPLFALGYGTGFLNFVDIPAVLDPEFIANRGYQTENGGWAGTFLGLSPAIAWGLRIVVIYAYVLVWVGWLWVGYQLYRTTYRLRDWTRLDTILARFRRHRVGMIGVAIVFLILVAGVFAPAIAPAPLDRSQAHTSFHDKEPNLDSQATLTYFDEEVGEVRTTTIQTANFNSVSNPQKGIGPMQYDEYDRFHPLGTTSDGTDLLTELLHGIQVYLFVAGGGALLAGLSVVAVVILVSTVGLRKTVDGVSDAITILPILPFILLASVWYYPTLSSIRLQLIVWMILFGMIGGVYIWKAIDTETESIDYHRLATGYRAIGISKLRANALIAQRRARNVLPSIVVYTLYCAIGFIIATAALSYLGHSSTTAPYGVYEWGTYLWYSRGARLSESNHLFVVPSVAFVTLLFGLYATSLGVRDAYTKKKQSTLSSREEMPRFAGDG